MYEPRKSKPGSFLRVRKVLSDVVLSLATVSKDPVDCDDGCDDANDRKSENESPLYGLDDNG